MFSRILKIRFSKINILFTFISFYLFRLMEKKKLSIIFKLIRLVHFVEMILENIIRIL